MKFIAFSDTHTSLFIHRKIVDFAKNHAVALLVCVGDFTLFCNFWKESLQELQNANIPMILVPGNHEYRTNIVKKIEEFDFVTNIDNDACIFQKAIFLGHGAMNYPKEISMFKYMDMCHKVHSLLKKNNHPIIMLSHLPPTDTPVAKSLKKRRDEKDAGSKKVCSFLDKLNISLLLCGHMHNPIERICKWKNTTIHNIACEAHLFEVEDGNVYWREQIPFEKWD